MTPSAISSRKAGSLVMPLGKRLEEFGKTELIYRISETFDVNGTDANLYFKWLSYSSTLTF
jgi:hypothetical protein